MAIPAYLWIKDDATNSDIQVTSSDGTVVGKVFAGKLRIEASQIKEQHLCYFFFAKFRKCAMIYL